MLKLWAFLTVLFAFLTVLFVAGGAWTVLSLPSEDAIVNAIPFLFWVLLFGLLTVWAWRRRKQIPGDVTGKPGAQDQKVEKPSARTPAQEKGHRLGIFITVIAALIIVFGLAAQSGPVAGLGFMGVLFGYGLARLWYWFRSA